MGRNKGRISSYHRGGGHKTRFKFIDRFRFMYNLPAKIVSFVYTPKHSFKLALLLYTNGYLSYIPAISTFLIGNYTSSCATPPNHAQFEQGLSLPLKFVKTGLKVSSIELYPGFGASVGRTSGLFATIIRKYLGLVLLKLPSGEFRFFSDLCFCTIGVAGHTLPRGNFHLKAGFNRWRGWRPVVRGRAMNPVEPPSWWENQWWYGSDYPLG